jgi:hypothetical protein
MEEYAGKIMPRHAVSTPKNMASQLLKHFMNQFYDSPIPQINRDSMDKFIQQSN